MFRLLSFSLILSLSQALNVYLSPQSSSLPPSLSPTDAASELSRHLGLEYFEPFPDVSLEQYYVEEPFVGQGHSNALLLTMDEEDVEGGCSVTIHQTRLIHSSVLHSRSASFSPTFL